MPLNLHSGGDFVPFIKYNAKSGKWTIKQQGADQEVEVDKPRLAFDFPTIKTGWIKFGPNGPPMARWDPSLKDEAPSPGEGYKRGFKVLVYCTNKVGGQVVGLREWQATAGVTIGSINAMFDTYEQQADDGQVPVFKCVGAAPVKGAHGTNYEPVFELDTWVQRDQIEGFNGALTPETAPQGQPFSDGSPPPDDSQAPGEYLEDDLPF